MTGKHAAAAEQAIARTDWYEPDYVEKAAHAVAARMLRAFADILDADTAGSAIPATVRVELDADDAHLLGRLRRAVAKGDLL